MILKGEFYLYACRRDKHGNFIYFASEITNELQFINKHLRPNLPPTMPIHYYLAAHAPSAPAKLSWYFKKMNDKLFESPFDVHLWYDQEKREWRFEAVKPGTLSKW
jgi:hypothetical protein